MKAPQSTEASASSSSTAASSSLSYQSEEQGSSHLHEALACGLKALDLYTAPAGALLEEPPKEGLGAEGTAAAASVAGSSAQKPLGLGLNRNVCLLAVCLLWLYSFIPFYWFLQDPYNNRPLPFLIGSQAFFESDTLGLQLLSDEGEESPQEAKEEEEEGEWT